MSTCSRSGCTKTLRKNNTTGVCGSGCLSLEAPPAKRAKGLGAPGLTPAKAEKLPTYDLSDLAKFRVVNEALGHDPDEVLNEFAREWLTELKTKMAEG